MQDFYKKYGWLLIAILNIVWIISTPSHFQKGGVDPDFYVFIALFVGLVSFQITLLFRGFAIAEKLLIAIPFAFISLFISALLVAPIFVELLYGDKTWFLWETKHRILFNTVYYGLNVLILTALSIAYFDIRKNLIFE